MRARIALLNHLEAAYPTIAYIAGSYPGQEISEYRSPAELGWARTVSLDHDFLGRDALAAEAGLRVPAGGGPEPGR